MDGVKYEFSDIISNAYKKNVLLLFDFWHNKIITFYCDL